jgi:C4-dicarboxylate-binding protein DctP
VVWPYWDNGFKSFSANTPIKTPADLKGKKLRIQSSKVLEEADSCPWLAAAGDGFLRGLSGVADGCG